MFAIGVFSDLTGLSAATLRYYHSEELLVPAWVDEFSQFRHYTVDQIARAGQVSLLRRAAFSIEQVRRVLDNPDLGSQLLHDQREALARQRREQDEALVQAAVALSHEPVVQTRQAEAGLQRRPGRRLETSTSTAST